MFNENLISGVDCEFLTALNCFSNLNASINSSTVSHTIHSGGITDKSNANHW